MQKRPYRAYSVDFLQIAFTSVHTVHTVNTVNTVNTREHLTPQKTMSNYRYILEKGSKKHHCPSCLKRYFVAYIDTQTGEYLPEQYGRCDSEIRCAYHLNPYSDGYAKMISDQEQGKQTNWTPQKFERVKKERPKPVFIPDDVLSQTRGGYEQNTFIQNLLLNVPFVFSIQDVERVISHYHLGTIQNGYRAGATTFPYIDKNGNVRAIQVKQFDKDNHTTGTDFIHSIIEKHHVRNNELLPEWIKPYNNSDLKVSCLFGEHFLSKYPNAIIYLFEAPKTAVYSTLYFGFPEYSNIICLAVFNLSSLNLEKCRALQGRDVFLFPDLSKDGKAFALWSKRAEEIQKQLPNTRFKVSDLLEQLAPEKDKADGKDIADYLITLDWRSFKKREIQGTPPPEPHPIEPHIKTNMQVVEVLPILNEENEVETNFDDLETFCSLENIANKVFGQLQYATFLDESFYPLKMSLSKDEILKGINKIGNYKAETTFDDMISMGIIKETHNPYIYQMSGKQIF